MLCTLPGISVLPFPLTDYEIVVYLAGNAFQVGLNFQNSQYMQTKAWDEVSSVFANRHRDITTRIVSLAIAAGCKIARDRFAGNLFF